MLGKAKLFTTHYLRAGYNHIALDEDAIKKTAFILPFGTFEHLKVHWLGPGPSLFSEVNK